MEPHLKLFNPVFHNVSGILKKNVLEEARKAFSDAGIEMLVLREI